MSIDPIMFRKFGSIVSTSIKGIKQPSNTTITEPGTLEPKIGEKRWYAPFPVSISGIKARVDTLPTGADLILNVQVHQAGGTTTVPVTITDGTAKASEEVAFDLSDDDFITVDIKQVGTITTGTNLSVTIVYNPTVTE